MQQTSRQAPVAAPVPSVAGWRVAAGEVTAFSAAEKPRRRRRRLAIEWLLVIGLALAATFLLRSFVVQAFFVPSGSMEPTLDIGDRILVIKQGWLSGPIKRGSIVVFHRPPGPSGACWVEPGVNDLVKRVIGLPGDTISSGGHGGNTVYINGKALTEPGWFAASGPEVGIPIRRTTIPPGEYYVLGDNRGDSCDSRYFGPIEASSVVGKVVMLMWRSGHPSIHMY